MPKHLTNGSLALGATPWQTLVRVVILTASPGIFSAVMIGMGQGIRYLAAHNDAGWNSWITWAGCGAVYVGIGAALAASSLGFFKKKLESA